MGQLQGVVHLFFSVFDHERHALEQLENLRQTGSVAEYKAVYDMLAAQTTLPMQLRIMWWERGLKDEIRTMCAVDPLTHKECADIGKAQSAACACDAHLLFDSAVATAIDPATHTDASDATSAEDDGDDGSDHELPVNASAEGDGDDDFDHELSVNKLPRFTSVTLRLLALFNIWCKMLRHEEGMTLISLKLPGALWLLQMVSNSDTNI